MLVDDDRAARPIRPEDEVAGWLIILGLTSGVLCAGVQESAAAGHLWWACLLAGLQGALAVLYTSYAWTVSKWWL